MEMPRQPGRPAAPEGFTWRFRHPADPARWLADPEHAIAPLEFRLAATPPGAWYEVACVAPGWVQRHVVEARAVVGLPGTLVVPPAAPEQVRAAITTGLGGLAEALADVLLPHAPAPPSAPPTS